MDYAYIGKLTDKFCKLAQQYGHYHSHQTGHTYDPHCRCEECQNKEFDLRSRVEEEEQLERDRKERLYGKDENDARTVSLPQTQVTGIPTADLHRVVKHTLDSIQDPGFTYWFATNPVGDGYKIEIGYSSSNNISPEQIQSLLNQILALKWPGTDFSFDIKSETVTA